MYGIWGIGVFGGVEGVGNVEGLPRSTKQRKSLRKMAYSPLPLKCHKVKEGTNPEKGGILPVHMPHRQRRQRRGDASWNLS